MHFGSWLLSPPGVLGRLVLMFILDCSGIDVRWCTCWVLVTISTWCSGSSSVDVHPRL